MARSSHERISIGLAGSFASSVNGLSAAAYLSSTVGVMVANRPISIGVLIWLRGTLTRPGHGVATRVAKLMCMIFDLDRFFVASGTPRLTRICCFLPFERKRENPSDNKDINFPSIYRMS